MELLLKSIFFVIIPGRKCYPSHSNHQGKQFLSKVTVECVVNHNPPTSRHHIARHFIGGRNSTVGIRDSLYSRVIRFLESVVVTCYDQHCDIDHWISLNCLLFGLELIF